MKWDECDEISNNSSLNKLFQIYWICKGNTSKSEQYIGCPWFLYILNNNVFFNNKTDFEYNEVHKYNNGDKNGVVITIHHQLSIFT